MPLIAVKMPLLAMFMARAMMVAAVIGSVSMYFYLHILRHSPLFHSRQDAYVPPPPFQWDRADRRNVIIVTNSVLDRSNILGKLFNEHPRVFYMEQPLYPFEMFKNLNYTHNSEYSGQVRAFLDNLFQCRFHGYKDYLTFLSHPGLASPQYRLASKALSSPPLCRRTVTSYTNNFMEQCPMLSPKWVSNVCASKMHVVVSILNARAPSGSLSGLLPLMTSESMATRVLYLVRDPRASVLKMLNPSERESAGSLNSLSVEETIKSFCAKLERDVDFSGTLPWEIRKQYHVVRFEEIYRNLSSTTEKVFRFAGINPESSVHDFVKEQAHNVKNFDEEVSWRISISKELVWKVQIHCARVMRILGYKLLYENEMSLMKNLDYSLLKEPEESYVIKK